MPGYNHNTEIYQMLHKTVTYTASNQVEGAYLEFGVGKSFIMAHKLLRGTRPMWGFDSFEGLPEPAGIDNTGKFHKGQFKVDEIAILKAVKQEATIVKGFYENTLRKQYLGLSKAAIVHIDCDLYESTKLVLEFIKPLLQEGTVLLFDDYYCFKSNPDKGEALALRESGIVVTEWLKYHIMGHSVIASRAKYIKEGE